MSLPKWFICDWCKQKIASYGIGGYHMCLALPPEYREPK